MLSYEGNTAPYLQYAYTRVQSIFRRADTDPNTLEGAIFLDSEAEHALALKLLQMSEVLDQMARDAFPHLLCNYLYDVASLYMRFYEACPVQIGRASCRGRGEIREDAVCGENIGQQET